MNKTSRIALARVTLEELELTPAQSFLLRCYLQQLERDIPVDDNAFFDMIFELTAVGEAQ